MSAAVVIRKQNKYMDIFNQLGATDPMHAILPEEYHIRTSFLFYRMCDRGIFISCGNGKYYIDNQAAALFKIERRQKAMLFLVATFFLVVIVMLLVFAIYF